jgi:hypothetical protein
LPIRSCALALKRNYEPYVYLQKWDAP